MRYLVQDLGPEGFREELAKRVSVGLTPAGEDLTKRYRGDHIGFHAQKCRSGSRTTLYYVGLNVPVGGGWAVSSSRRRGGLPGSTGMESVSLRTRT
jgi:sulfite reductase beta subunit-like hemoprotein